MLSIDVCLKCWENSYSAVGLQDKVRSFLERIWTSGVIHCPNWSVSDITVGRAKVMEPPPPWCKYVFEHAVAEGFECSAKKSAKSAGITPT